MYHVSFHNLYIDYYMWYSKAVLIVNIHFYLYMYFRTPFTPDRLLSYTYTFIKLILIFQKLLKIT